MIICTICGEMESCAHEEPDSGCRDIELESILHSHCEHRQCSADDSEVPEE